jgi:hypothetical protein
MILTSNQTAVLGYKVKEPQAWADHAESHFGLEKGTQCMLDKVARWQSEYDSAPDGDKIRTVKEAALQAVIDNHPDKPMNDWKVSMAVLDFNMPRFAEDILDSMADKSGVAQISLDRLQAKKDKRSEKP